MLFNLFTEFYFEFLWEIMNGCFDFWNHIEKVTVCIQKTFFRNLYAIVQMVYFVCRNYEVRFKFIENKLLSLSLHDFTWVTKIKFRVIIFHFNLNKSLTKTYENRKNHFLKQHKLFHYDCRHQTIIKWRISNNIQQYQFLIIKCIYSIMAIPIYFHLMPASTK